MTNQRSVLFLQGHPARIIRDLVKEMKAEGVTCHVVNFSISDWYCNVGLGAQNYWGKVRNWRNYLETFIDENNITDIVYYADQRPYHRIARLIARERNLGIFAYEFGYFRPDWITLERGGMGAFSHFPNDPTLIKELAGQFEFEKPSGHYPHTFFKEAFNEVIYHTLPVLLPFFFYHYRKDRYYHPFVDYLSFLPRLLTAKSKAKYAEGLIDKLLESKKKYYVVTMQLQSDYQIRRASRYVHLSEMIEEILISFVARAPEGSMLVFKLHPLDNNYENWPKVVALLAEKHGCSDRVETIDGGDLAKLFSACSGVVLINSTAAMPALEVGIPVKTLGIAIFDIPQITFQGSLDDFWTEGLPADRETFEAFRKLLMATVQIKGSFFNREGRRVAAKEMTRRILSGEVNHHGAYVEPPPRVEKAKEIGVPIVYDE